jgi:23S rRNA (uridine2552-2'-O)-methyltransferase
MTAPDKRFEQPKPVAAGEIFEVEIESMGGAGDGIAKKDGFVLFVKGANKGQKCRVRVLEVKRTFAIAEKI